MKILAIETSTNVASVAMMDGDQVLAEAQSFEPKSHSSFVNPAIDIILKKSNLQFSDIDLIALDNGPGSFTGVRVAVNVGKSLAYALDKPIVAVNSLLVMSFERSFEQPVVAMLNAFKNMIYCAVVQDGEYLQEPSAVRIEDLQMHLQKLNLSVPVLCLGEGYTQYEKYFSEALKSKLKRESSLDYPQASQLGRIACKNRVQPLDWKFILPLYIRESAAEENFKKS